VRARANTPPAARTRCEAWRRRDRRPPHGADQGQRRFPLSPKSRWSATYPGHAAGQTILDSAIILTAHRRSRMQGSSAVSTPTDRRSRPGSPIGFGHRARRNPSRSPPSEYLGADSSPPARSRRSGSADPRWSLGSFLTASQSYIRFEQGGRSRPAAEFCLYAGAVKRSDAAGLDSLRIRNNPDHRHGHTTRTRSPRAGVCVGLQMASHVAARGWWP